MPKAQQSLYVEHDLLQKDTPSIYSAWVDASAGTGKTKTLIDRVIKLLLLDIEPKNILCLTFTNAAASEMQNRIFAKLSYWTTLTDEKALDMQLSEYLPEPIDEMTRQKARRLFGKLIDNHNNKLQIQTLHAFCQTLLKRFPLEAGISPQFSIIEDSEAQKKLKESIQNLIYKSTQETDPDYQELSEGLTLFSTYMNEIQFHNLMETLISEIHKIHRIFSLYPSMDAIELHCMKTLGIDKLKNTKDLCHQFFEEMPFKNQFLPLVNILNMGTKTDCDKASMLTAYIDKSISEEEYIWPFIDIFLTGSQSSADRQIRKILISKKLATNNPGAVEQLADIAEHCLGWVEQYNQQITLSCTLALYQFSQLLIREYSHVKKNSDFIDYNDLIYYSLKLLHNIDSGTWVLFKLDQQIHHILIDESQDTSLEQWAFITTLSQDFFSGKATEFQNIENISKTIFAVGDKKQSIYSFQGADPKSYEYYKNHFKQQAENSQKIWQQIQLTINYRSNEQILAFVDTCFRETKAKKGVLSLEEKSEHHPFHQRLGQVSIWPLCARDEKAIAAPWKPPVEKAIGKTARQKLAKSIAAEIHHLLINKAFIPSQGRVIEPRDILILFRRRTGIIDEIIFELHKLNIPTTGTDRLILGDQLIIKDLLSLLRFMLLPDDDLNLANLLKSPLINCNEEDLFMLCYQRGASSLWKQLQQASSSRFHKIYQYLEELRSLFSQYSLYKFYSFVLMKKALFCDLSIYDSLLSRLGIDTKDLLEEFLIVIYNYEKNHAPFAQLFLQWFDQQKIEIKRQFEENKQLNAIKFKTVHGAKGLQSPVVFIADSNQIPRMRDMLLWSEDPHLFFWSPKKALYSNKMLSLYESHKEKQSEEYHRLLYVALTRAQDYLYLCGWKDTDNIQSNSWHEFTLNSLKLMPEKRSEIFRYDPKSDPVYSIGDIIFDS